MAQARIGTLTLCLALGVTSITLGQAPAPQGDAILGPMLSNPGVQKELKLSGDQITKLRDSLGKVVDKYKGDLTKLDKMTPDERDKKLKALGEDSRKVISSVLDAKQWKRYKQIEWQIIGFGALQDPELQKELKLSEEQKKKIDDIFTDANKKIQELDKNRETSPEKFQAVVKDTEKKANDVLSEEQKKSLKEIKGPEFQFAPPRGGR
ncbi:MAG: hypothetical protein ACYC3I_23640 [Gemmataceae bacterium]